MPSYEGATQKLDAPTLPARTSRVSRAVWRQIILNIAYVLVAGPRGLLHLLTLAIGLIIDFLHLVLRLLVAALLGLLFTAARTASWLLKFGPRFLWVGTIASLAWLVQSVWRLASSIVRGVARLLVGVLNDLLHPRGAWQRAMYSMYEERERARMPRRRSIPRVQAAAAALQRQGNHAVDAWAAGLRRLRLDLVPQRWLTTPALWRRLALWERTHTIRWLNTDLPPHDQPESAPASRAVIMAELPLASLGYVMAKVPLGALALGLVALAAGISIELLHFDNLGAVVGVALATIAALHLLARASARLAHRAYSPSAAVRRLHVAEALVAQERGKAERAEQSRRDLIINVGHELRTPAASILGHVESVLLALDTPESQLSPATLRRYLDIVHREAGRLSALVDDLLAVASAERTELQLAVAPVDAAAVTHEVYEALAPLARRERQVTLVHQAQPGLPPLLADRQRLSQILFNLARNAITYTPPGGIVSITVSRADSDRVRITVADTGSGIAPADLERVFERFYRTDVSRSRESGGFGLGLAIAQDLVGAMGGTITAESTVGEGSAFHVWLPIAANPAEQRLPLPSPYPREARMPADQP